MKNEISENDIIKKFKQLRRQGLKLRTIALKIDLPLLPIIKLGDKYDYEILEKEFSNPDTRKKAEKRLLKFVIERSCEETWLKKHGVRI